MRNPAAAGIHPIHHPHPPSWTDDYEPKLYVYGAGPGAVSDMISNRTADGSYEELYVVTDQARHTHACIQHA